MNLIGDLNHFNHLNKTSTTVYISHNPKEKSRFEIWDTKVSMNPKTTSKLWYKDYNNKLTNNAGDDIRMDKQSKNPNLDKINSFDSANMSSK